MNNKIRIPTAKSVAVLLGACVAPLVSSQENDQEEIFELSPFEVDGSKDVGYAAQSTLAGSRLNTNLKDVGAAVDVFTKEFLEDIGADTLEDALLYGNNTQEDIGDDNASFQQDFKVQPQVRSKYKVRGLSQTRARDYFTWSLPSDLYNAERIDQSRGPNSILFGIGSAGGVSNVSTKRAHTRRDRLSIGVKLASWNSKRYTLDYNKVLIEDTLAVRFNTVQASSESWRDNIWEKKQGYHGALTYKPNDKTNIRASIETMNRDDTAARTLLPKYQAYYWNAIGRPTFDTEGDVGIKQNNNGAWVRHNPTFLATRFDPLNAYGDVLKPNGDARWPPVVYNNGGPDFVYVDNGDGYLTNRDNVWRTTAIGGVPMLADYTTINTDGFASERDLNFKTYSASIDHRLTKQINLELAYNKTSSEWSAYNIGNEHLLEGDPNQQISYGTDEAFLTAPNPYAGHLYFEDKWQKNTRWNDEETLRAMASYNLKTDRFGEHRLAAMVSNFTRSYQRDIDELGVVYSPETYSEGEYWGYEYNSNSDSYNWSGYTPEAGKYDLLTRHYIENEIDPSDYRVADWRTIPNSISDPLSGETVDLGWRLANSNMDDRTYTTYLFGMQNFFFDRKLVTTLGYRGDDASVTNFGWDLESIDFNEDGQISENEQVVRRDPDNFNQRIRTGTNVTNENADYLATTTAGAVYHLKPWISLSYNISENTGAPGSAWGAPNLTDPIDPVANTGLSGGNADPGTGTGQDYGIKLDLHEGKYFLGINYYTVEATGSLIWADEVDGTFNNILRRLNGTSNFANLNGLELYNKETGEYYGQVVDPTPDENGEYVPAGIIPEYSTVSITSRDRDYKSQGYEVSLTANPFEGLKLRANYSYTTRETYQVYNRVRQYTQRWREWLPGYIESMGQGVSVLTPEGTLVQRDVSLEDIPILEWKQANQTWSDQLAQNYPDGDATAELVYHVYADDVFDYQLDYQNDVRLENSQEEFGVRHHKANLFADYSFRSGALKGFSAGFGVRWQSGAQTGYRVDWDEERQTWVKDRDTILTTGDRLNNDLKLAYKGKGGWFGKDTNWRLQLNVRNVFDDTDLDVARYQYNNLGERINTRYYVPAPRHTSLSMTVTY
ncbi:hypothetical protein QEH56_14750 [Pelagicoccus enzymogenes]|uniref:TonB-dependent receptor plug domain-containing protein n=1 Tax=Pelagicoccus enzymogenes TaxID=2773457 RepID=UPI00280CFC86|nr:TonB-dependent receptor plug domain-containing protein [Pelagicoccus enzymogenes]MDQ8199423.1 hypothetical protein [Pelagicoccus enzymogenes]